METDQPVVIPNSIKADIKEYVRVDDGLKEARGQMKEARSGMKECSERIIEFMRQSDMDRFSLKKGEQFLILQQKELKVRPDAEIIKAKIRDLLAAGITDPAAIWDEVQKCGGVKVVWKLSRRSKRKKLASTKADKPRPLSVPGTPQ